MPGPPEEVREALDLLDVHYESFSSAKAFAEKTGHMVPSDSAAWSEILVSLLTGLKGLDRKKGADLEDGSDVKAANCWSAIDTPRFNGSLPAGRTSKTSRRPDDVSALDDRPFIFFVLWDEEGEERIPRCRVWCVRSQVDPEFRAMATRWYEQRAAGTIKSNNFQLHPPRNIDTDEIRNTCGNLLYPLLFYALRKGDQFECVRYEPSVMTEGACQKA